MTDNEILIPLADDDGPLDNEDLQAWSKEVKARRQHGIWTDTRKMKLGAYINGVLAVLVPGSKKKYRQEVYVRDLDDTGWTTAILTSNSGVGILANRTVWVGHPPEDKDRWYVKGEAADSEYNGLTEGATLIPHADDHTLRGTGFDGGLTNPGRVGRDVVFVDDRQLHNISIQPKDGMVARLTSGWIRISGDPVWYTGEDLADLTSQIPSTADQARWVLVELSYDASTEAFTVHYNYGTAFWRYGSLTLASQMPSFTANRYPVGAILCYNGQSAINYYTIWAGMSLRQLYDTGLKHNLSATADPTSGDDSDDGYTVGSMWVNVNQDKFFICVDSTAASAVWTEGGAMDIGPVSTLTISSGNITITSDADLVMYHIAGEGGAADTLSTIQGADHVGQMLVLTRNSSEVITISSGASSNQICIGSGNVSAIEYIMYQRTSALLVWGGTCWYLIGGGGVVSKLFTNTSHAYVNMSWSEYGGVGSQEWQLNWNFTSQTANTVLAGPSSGGAAAPSFRSLTLADMPSGIEPFVFTVYNASASTVAAGDVGTLLYHSSQGWCFYQGTATTTRLQPAVVTSGGISGASISVQARGNVTIDYTGTAPTAGDLLKMSTGTAFAVEVTASYSQDVCAVATGTGSGGSVEAVLLASSITMPSHEGGYMGMYLPTAVGSSDFVATINGTPTASQVVYNTPSSGDENIFSANGYWNWILHNTTRGTTREVTTVSAATNTLTTEYSVDSWASGDTITLRSQTVTGAGGTGYYVDIQLETPANTVVYENNPNLVKALTGVLTVSDTGAPNSSCFLSIHPYRSFYAGDETKFYPGDVPHTAGFSTGITNQRLAIRWAATGSGTLTFTMSPKVIVYAAP